MVHITIEEAYSVLELDIGAPEEHVKKQYKRLALKTHPDKNPDDPEAHKKFLLISEAYKRITDPDSFKDDEDEEPTEEEMEAMFASMFGEVFASFGMNDGFSAGGFPGGGLPMEFFDILDQMVYEDEDDEDYYPHNGGMHQGMFEEMLMNELLGGMGGMGGMGNIFGPPPGRLGSHKVKTKKNSKKSKKGVSKKTTSKQNENEDDSEDWETEDEDDGAELSQSYFMPSTSFKAPPNPPYSSKQATYDPRKQSELYEEDEDDYDEDADEDDEEAMMAFMMAAMNGMGERELMNMMMNGNMMGGMSGMGGKKKGGKSSKKEKTPVSNSSSSNKPQTQSRSNGATNTSSRHSEKDSKVGDDEIPASNYPFSIGDRVVVNKKNRGVVSYIGTVHYASGVYVGIVMDDPSQGKNSGTIKGVEYFTCPKGKKGLMVSVKEVEPLGR